MRPNAVDAPPRVVRVRLCAIPTHEGLRPMPAPDAARELDLLNREIAGCRACPRLVAWREQVAREKRASYREWTYWGRPVPGFGDAGASIYVVGLAPAAHGGNRTGRVFTGDRSGDWVYGALHRAGFANQPTSTDIDDGLELDGAYIGAIVRCAPPDNRPTREEREACLPFAQRELDLLELAQVVVALGAFAHNAVCDLYKMRPRPKFGHMAESPLPDGRTLLDSYHPSQRNTFTGLLTTEMFDAVFHRAREISSKTG